MMPRESRKRSESKMYHVMIRGNERKEIFLDDGDKNFMPHNRRKMERVYPFARFTPNNSKLIFAIAI